MHVSRTLAAAALCVAALGTTGIAPATAAGSSTHAAPRVSAAASWFSDGGFETPTAPADSFTTFAAGQTIGPWTVTTGNVDLIGAGYWQAADGKQSLDLDGGQAGAVAQTFATIPGAEYAVSYALAGNPDGGPAVRTGEVLIDGKVAQAFAFNVTGKAPTDMGYVTEYLTFWATGPQTTLGFRSTTPGAFGPVIDDVDVAGCLLLCL
ncbi:MAG TPA: choice-of-anchor C family protein [Actinospica sp.]|nr:choice-of-anchor C family protein [Actinospica sp.]